MNRAPVPARCTSPPAGAARLHAELSTVRFPARPKRARAKERAFLARFAAAARRAFPDRGGQPDPESPRRRKSGFHRKSAQPPYPDTRCRWRRARRVAQSRTGPSDWALSGRASAAFPRALALGHQRRREFPGGCAQPHRRRGQGLRDRFRRRSPPHRLFGPRGSPRCAR